MLDNKKINADRFTGFANIYDSARPKAPSHVIEIAVMYLSKKPNMVVDLGAGTGLSTMVWDCVSKNVIGVEPSADMIKIAREKAKNKSHIEFVQEFSFDTKLQSNCADVVACSQSFHWMEPQSTLCEVNRILKPQGIYMAYDCDWPPICNWKAELAYQKLFDLVDEIEKTSEIKDSFIVWDKNNHLSNIQNSGYFSFSREIVFSNRELCTAKRFIDLAYSQGGVQSILKTRPELIASQLKTFETEIIDIFEDEEYDIEFCYRMRIGIK